MLPGCASSGAPTCCLPRGSGHSYGDVCLNPGGVLLDAVALLRERGVPVRCAIAGDGRARAELEKQIEDLGLSGCVELVGWLDNVQKVRFLEDLDLFVSPSLNEPFGFVYLDAMRVGAPIIACPTVGARYIFSTPGTAELVPLEDAPALADAIERALDVMPLVAAGRLQDAMTALHTQP